MSTMTTEAPASNIAKRPRFKDQYDHFINGEWVAPSSGEYFRKHFAHRWKTIYKSCPRQCTGYRESH